MTTTFKHYEVLPATINWKFTRKDLIDHKQKKEMLEALANVEIVEREVRYETLDEIRASNFASNSKICAADGTEVTGRLFATREDAHKELNYFVMLFADHIDHMGMFLEKFEKRLKAEKI